MGPQARNLQGLLGATRPGTAGPGPANTSTRPPSQIEGSSLQSHVIRVMAVCDSSYREGIQEVHGDCPADRNTANACDASAGEGRREEARDSLRVAHDVSRLWKTAGHGATCLWPSTWHPSIRRMRQEGQPLLCTRLEASLGYLIPRLKTHRHACTHTHARTCRVNPVR